MDVNKAVSAYVERIVSSVGGMKVLLLDDETTPIVSTSLTQSSLLQHEVYLTDRIDNAQRDRMRHLKCLVLVRPSASSLEAIERELNLPRYGSYSLYFTNTLKKADIERLATADEHDVVQEVQEYFCDYVPINRPLFSINYATPPNRLWATNAATSSASGTSRGAGLGEWDPEALERHTQGLLSVLLSLKKKPVIRYERMSALAKKLGEDVLYNINEPLASLFDFRRTDAAPLLLILDRRNDPVTPLLSQWTYQAMVHELMGGINNGRVSLAHAEGVRPELREIVLSEDQDPFFATNLYDNFGDLGASIKRYVEEYQKRTANSASIETVADMKRFVEAYPEFRKLGGNVSKHVALLGELSRRVESDRLLEVSELEQSLASNESHASDLRNVYRLLDLPDVKPDAKLRLACLYALRYQKYSGNQINQIVAKLLDAGMPESRAALVFVLLNIAGADQRQDDLFANENFFSRGKSALKGLKGVENVYTQHSPHLVETIEDLLRGRLKETSYPFIGPGGTGAAGGLHQRPQDVIIFVVGGATYEEARTIALLNAQHDHSAASGTDTPPVNASGAASGLAGGGIGGASGPSTRFLLGGTCIHSSSSFLDMIQDVASRLPSSFARPPPTSNAASAASQPSLNLSIGPVQLNVGGRQAGQPGEQGSFLDPGRMGEAAEGARDLARGLFGRVRGAVDSLS
ncbi:putative vacuolar protein sorting protein VpsB [Acaromyces ingoldii]|uniref:Putative vacuolar protein sorting protein VpsB n=1 Tax=Acaromyces ingoldii TaxID=215250 RepID=A0A316YE64_9BASI|nr:putative vacuolar protein sorting protein VpsB [Acaromyces ingoldii]PWN87154.1 putative vacuolar protein sorting protein VpsB [Acaromyces ingoldii]